MNATPLLSDLIYKKDIFIMQVIKYNKYKYKINLKVEKGSFVTVARYLNSIL